MKKRSVTISGHATSITLEDEFWDALKKIAAEENKSINELISGIDIGRSENLSSALRLHVLQTLQNKLRGG
ncbi:MAG: ribbon-helix-helix domain-containing protein [Alphaproteobacteria bacterium]